MQDNNDNIPKDTNVNQKLHPKRISELNFELIQAERGELKLELERILDNVMEIIYFKALEEGERLVVDLDIARVYKRGFLAAQKCGFITEQNKSISDFLLRGFQNHVQRYLQSQQKKLTETLDVS